MTTEGQLTQTSTYPPPPAVDSDPRSLTTILADLWDKTGTLIRQEMKLASTELDQKLDKAKRDLIALGLAGGALFAGFSAFVAAVILLLAEVMEPWLAAGIVAIASGGAGYLLLQRERRAIAELQPEQTIESVKKDVKTIREATQ